MCLTDAVFRLMGSVWRSQVTNGGSCDNESVALVLNASTTFYGPVAFNSRPVLLSPIAVTAKSDISGCCRTLAVPDGASLTIQTSSPSQMITFTPEISLAFGARFSAEGPGTVVVEGAVSGTGTIGAKGNLEFKSTVRPVPFRQRCLSSVSNGATDAALLRSICRDMLVALELCYWAEL